jgi:hypothetical protein
MDQRCRFAREALRRPRLRQEQQAYQRLASMVLAG